MVSWEFFIRGKLLWNWWAPFCLLWFQTLRQLSRTHLCSVRCVWFCFYQLHSRQSYFLRIINSSFQIHMCRHILVLSQKPRGWRVHCLFYKMNQLMLLKEVVHCSSLQFPTPQKGSYCHFYGHQGLVTFGPIRFPASEYTCPSLPVEKSLMLTNKH